MLIIDSKFEIIKIIDVFLDDSQIVGNIFRIFRKAIMILTNDELHKGKITSEMSHKQYNKELKVIKNNNYNLLI